MPRRARVPRGLAGALRSARRQASRIGQLEEGTHSSDEGSDSGQSDGSSDSDIEMNSDSDDGARYTLANASGKTT